MLDFFQYVVAFFETIGQLISSAVTATIQMFTTLLSVVTIPQVIQTYSFAWLATSAGIVLSIAVLKIIFGR